MWDNIKTALAVIVLSGLIWAFAEQAVTRHTSVIVPLELRAPSDDVLYQILDENENLVNQINVKLEVQGPTGRIKNINELYRDTKYIEPARIPIEPELGNSTARWALVTNLLDNKLESNDKKLYLRIISSNPPAIQIKATKLTRVMLPVAVYIGNDKIPHESVTPEKVEAYVTDAMPRVARAVLPEALRQRAEKEPVKVNVVVQIPFSNRPPETFEVEIKLPQGAVTEQIKKQTVKNPQLGIVMPNTMQGKYWVQIDNLDSQLSDYQVINCQGLAADLDKYFKSDKHLLIEIFESDVKNLNKEIVKIPTYNLPPTGGIEVTNIIKSPVRLKIVEIPKIPE